ncbi:MAG: PHP domain-containing protein [Rikenellaceae bacterium]|nr:PHP domain-containing protein [Rikenellaceae bacterium]
MANNNKPEVVKVNAHLHTPYSFSAFDGIPQALDMAVKEGVKVVGINDFYSMDGYDEWNEECRKRKLAPLFNIEFISLNKEDQQAGIRVNDPNNPGRTYLSGKGLAFPVNLPEPYASQLADVRAESNAHVKKMCGKLNGILADKNTGITLDFNDIAIRLTKGSIRERHLAKALREAVYTECGNDESKIKEMFRAVFGGKDLKSSVSDHAAVENEIRGNLLKAGGGAFVPEDPKAFLPMETVRQIILAAGGIPAYPFLADDAKGGFTDFEEDVVKTAETLKKRGIHSVEFITTRNSVEWLEKYAGYLSENGFAVTFGSEHNTPAMEPVELFARGGKPLTEKLMRINYEGACITAAHQELVKHGKRGFVDKDGNADSENTAYYIEYGDKVIKEAIGQEG